MALGASALPPSAFPFSEGILRDLLDVSLTAVHVVRPLYGPDGTTVEDFSLDYLNPAGQRMTGLPEHPGGTLLTRFPNTLAAGIFDYYRRVFDAGEPLPYEVNYQAEGLDNYYRFQAKRNGDLLLVSFTDTADQPRTAVEIALRQAQAAERAARADAEAQREQLHEVLHQAPVAIALLDGPTYCIALANPTVCELWARPETQLLGRPLLDALPELQGQGVDTLLDGVLHSGEPFFGTELPFQVVRHGHLDTIYFNFVYQPQRNARGETTGVLVVATDVTTIVTARQQVQTQEQETAALNEELATANEEIQANNEQLQHAQEELLSLNQELEARIQDRTAELLRAQQAAVWQQQRLERLFLEAPAAICILAGPKLVYELVNPGYQALFPGRELAGKPILDALPEIAGHEVHRTFRQVYELGITHREQALLIPIQNLATGQLEDRYFNYIQQARYDAQGRIDGVVVFAFEVTEQVVARQASQASARQLRLITDALPVLIGYLDPSQRYRFANEAYRAWFGQDPADLLGQSIRDVAGSQAYPNIAPYLQRALAGERVEFEAEMPFRPDFTKVIRTTYLPDVQDGRVAGLFTLVTDITDQVRAREQVQSLNEELAAINEELLASNEELGHSNVQLTRTNTDLDNFIYTASHDLKAPISNIEGLLYLLRNELPVDVAAGEYVGPMLTRMLDAVERFKRTIEQLTEVSKLQQAHAPDTTAVDLTAVVQDVRLDLAPLLRDTQARLHVHVADFPPIRFSEKNLRSVVYNLLSNAVKYRHPDRRPHVDVRAHLRPGHTVLEVHDNGLGIAEQHLPKLFTMFQRFHDHVEGTGIGLYMVKRMIENAGGRIEVESQLGRGTTFIVYLPHPDA